MQAGATPSVSDVAGAAGVSRATAYRYFPSQAALVQTVVDEGLGPILTWRPRSRDPRRRVAQLLDTAMPRVEAFEATLKKEANRFRALSGAIRAATRAGQVDRAREHARTLLTVCARADASARPELAEARKLVSSASR